MPLPSFSAASLAPRSKSNYSIAPYVFTPSPSTTDIDIANLQIEIIGVKCPAIVREISDFAIFPSFPHFGLYFKNLLKIVIIFRDTKTFCVQTMSDNTQGVLQQR